MKPVIISLIAALGMTALVSPVAQSQRPQLIPPTAFHTVQLEGLNVFYREAGLVSNPTIVLLHGFPSASHQYQGLIDRLALRYHLIAPDYIGFGNSESPTPAQFKYSFDHLTDIVQKLLEVKKVTHYSLYAQDYGGPIALRLIMRHPEQLQALIVQNASFYLEAITSALDPLAALWKDRNPTTEAALEPFFARQTTVFQHTQGAADPTLINPDVINLDQAILDRPGNHAIQLELFYDYRNTPPLYQRFQALLREAKSPVLAVWGKNDPFFNTQGALLLKRDVPNAQVNLLDAGHFALDDHADEIAALIQSFLVKKLH